MNLKLQLKILSFLQFCLWGSWLTTLGSYMFVTLKLTARQSAQCIARSVSPRC
ncbi:Nucleoside permease NupG [Klebsiella pneumoniae]|nr:Nucleoside permease NupG [Klebsiella pneumoniae]